jgi:hypothetical protein
MLNRDSQEIDDFFMEDVWRPEDREEAQVLGASLLEVYVANLAAHLELSNQDTHHLASEMGNHSISAFLDTAYRLNHHELLGSSSKDNSVRNVNTAVDFFLEEVVQEDLGSSRVLRCRLVNSMLRSMSSKELFDNIQEEPKEIYLEALDLPLAPEKKYWKLHYQVTKLLPQKIKDFLKAFYNRLQQEFRDDLIRIGHLAMRKQHMWQLPDIDWVPLKLELDPFLNHQPIEKRRELYDTLRVKWLSDAVSIKGWNYVVGQNAPTDEFLELLLVFIILKSEPLFCNKNDLYAAINRCEGYLKSISVSALFSQGDWFRFQNGILAIAARKLSLPIIEFQHSGDPIYRKGHGYDQSIDDEKRFFDMHIMQREVYLDVNLGQLRKMSKRTNNNKRVLLTLTFFSDIYEIELKSSLTSRSVRRSRQKIIEAINQLSNNVELYIKVKGFGYSLFQGAEEFGLILPDNFLNTKVYYLLDGISEYYLDYVDLHITDSLSTTLTSSLRNWIPTVAFADPLVIKPRKRYVDLFNELNESGILCTSVGQFVENIRLVLDSNNDWNTESRLKATQHFIKCFGASEETFSRDVFNQMLVEEICSSQKVSKS